MNWAVDYSWWATDENETVHSDRLLTFFYDQGIGTYGNLYTLDGARLSDTHSLGLVSTNAVAALAATDVPSAHAQEFVRALWDTEPQYGNYRYYDGLLQFMSFLHVSGQFRAYLPEGGCTSTELSCTDGLIDCADSDCAADAACDVCGNGICGGGEDSCTCVADCGAAPSLELSCSNGADDDCDGLSDCADADCTSDPACEICGNGSCASGEDVCSCPADCGAAPAEDCENGVDDDCDGSVDCGDTDCSAVPLCQVDPGSLELAPILGSGMVLQGQTSVPVFGQAAAGAPVTVEFQGQVTVGTADANGDFVVTLAPLAASSAPASMTISSGFGASGARRSTQSHGSSGRRRAPTARGPAAPTARSAPLAHRAADSRTSCADHAAGRGNAAACRDRPPGANGTATEPPVVSTHRTRDAPGDSSRPGTSAVRLERIRAAIGARTGNGKHAQARSDDPHRAMGKGTIRVWCPHVGSPAIRRHHSSSFPAALRGRQFQE